MTRLRRRIKRHVAHVRWGLREPDFYREWFAKRSDDYAARYSVEDIFGRQMSSAARRVGYHAGRVVALREQALAMAGRG